eukprot:TRINITY_DN124991_c0_g1_i1.p1 TRINITY_DN124991_c0_g1~~TRINITY_DN124991_c0_g1_i1.p1  ORF type:complete len:209 (+),score=35.17 TRINITY_DN124991_c0_g1_i1:59-628(+)
MFAPVTAIDKAPVDKDDAPEKDHLGASLLAVNVHDLAVEYDAEDLSAGEQPKAPPVLQPSYVKYTRCDPSDSVSGAPQQPLIILTPDMRVIYTSRSTGQKFSATVVERTRTGWLLQLDVDGGIKEVDDIDIWRLEYAVSGEEVEIKENTSGSIEVSARTVKKTKKNKKSRSESQACCPGLPGLPAMTCA